MVGAGGFGSGSGVVDGNIATTNFFDTRLKILTLAPQVLQVTNMTIMDWHDNF